jgi:hypothetical protein
VPCSHATANHGPAGLIPPPRPWSSFAFFLVFPPALEGFTGFPQGPVSISLPTLLRTAPAILHELDTRDDQ